MKKKNTEPKEDGTLQAPQVESQESAEAPVVETEEHTDTLCVVIPYAKEFYSSDALKLAIRSWCNFFTDENFKIAVIGDKEDWFSDKLIHVPMTMIPAVKTEFHWLVTFYALSYADIPDGIIFAEPDTFLVNPIGLSHIAINKTKGLDKYGFYDFETGLPFPVSKEILACLYEQMTDGIPNTDIANGYLRACKLTHPIQLDWKTDSWLLPVVNEKPNMNRFDELVAKKCFMKAIGDGWSPFLKGCLEDMFPYQSIYEK